MLEASRRQILESLADDALVLDVGGGAMPFERADWVLDLIPYEQRASVGGYEYDATPAQERFGPETWVSRDICDHDPWPFGDRQFDFAVCSHTLEDVRDPVWVCHELIRVARAGYIEVPSRLEEQSFGFQGPWAGWGHHRWLIDVGETSITFVFKHHILHGRDSDHFERDFHSRLTAQQRVQSLWWRDSFRYEERVMTDAATIDAYLADFVAANRPPPVARGLRRGLSGRGASLLRMGRGGRRAR